MAKMLERFKEMDDKWVLLIGIPFVGFVVPLVFSGFSLEFIFSEGYRNMIVSVFTTLAIWLGVRWIVVYLWEKYPWEKNPWKHLIYEIAMVFGYTVIIGVLNFMLYVYTPFLEVSANLNMTLSVFITLLITFFITSLHEAWFFYNQWNISLVKAQELEKENIISQYETLKTQVNPHFLFNTLNTLTTLIEEDPPKAVNYVGQTAGFLRSVLGMKDKELIPVKEELELIAMFYKLQKERFGENIMLETDISEQKLKLQVPPLALQMLMENAIKHNIITAEKPLHIKIGEIGHNRIFVSNNLQRKISHGSSSGIGLINIKKRYRFFTGNQVEILESANSFEVRMPLI